MTKDNTFNKLLERYLNGTCSDDERMLVEQWYDMLDSDAPDIDESELLQIKARIHENLDRKIHQSPTKTDEDENTAHQRWRILAMAASFVGILITLSYFISAPIDKPTFISNNVTVVDTMNITGKPIQIILPDKSEVTLQPRSSITYPKHFDGESREVSLSGEAFFKVTKDKAHPFKVFSRELVTQVLGTSFTVKFDSITKTSEVSVRTGKVSVSENNSGQSLFNKLLSHKEKVELLPNQRVLYSVDAKELLPILTDNPLPLINEDESASSTSQHFVYADVPLAAVFENLSKIYGISIVVENASIKQCKFTGDLTGENLTAQLTFICKSTGLTFRVTGTVIEIQGSGCNR